MSQLAHILAVDGGGTKTVAVVFTVAGQELARCRVGPANLYRDPVAGLATIAAAWQQACALAGLSPAHPPTNRVVSGGRAGASAAAQRRPYAASCEAFAARRL